MQRGKLLDQEIRHEVSTLLIETEFLLVQLVTAHETRGHRTFDQQNRIANLHRRLDQLEQQLRRHARELGEEQPMTLGQLRRRLGSLIRPHALDALAGDAFYTSVAGWLLEAL